MSNILLVLSSPRGEISYSTKVARALVEKLINENPGYTVTVRDLNAAPLPHIAESFTIGGFTPAESRTEAQRAALLPSDAVIQEVVSADIIIVASAMINFGISSTLKSWFDHLVRADLTFSYATGKPQGLLSAKKVYLVAARGGVYSEGPAQAYDFQVPYIKALFGFIGLTDVETITVEGVAGGGEAAEKAVSAALAHVAAL